MLDPEKYDYYLLNTKPRVPPYKIKSIKIRNIITKKAKIFQAIIKER